MEIPSRILLGRNVYRIRQRRRNLTQEKLAELAEIDRRYIQRIEAGTANPSIDVVVRLRRSLKCTWKELLRGMR